ncbi:efflux RND transporter periplasmic adaptor subunit [Pseudomonas sp. Q2-TVG4-2]|nr:efflux RND transporter periplasmic adaptor subunit [Pseudomonas sp. Q2-TVG4-2]
MLFEACRLPAVTFQLLAAARQRLRLAGMPSNVIAQLERPAMRAPFGP